MSLIAKLWGAKRGVAEASCAKLQTAEPATYDRNSSQERIRILLFRECEWRGRKLLFDSLAVHRNGRRCSSADNNNESPAHCKNNAHRNNVEASGANPCEHAKLLGEDISLLSEMIFGTVAMTYKGPSFKIHAMNSPSCLMCTKVFPFSEHSVCKQSDRHSSETLGSSTNCDSNSSNSSLRTQHSRFSSGNSLSPCTLRKNSTCSSTGSGWDIDVPKLGSSHSLDGTSGVTAGGSLSSLRRRWTRVVSTSLNRTESDDAFGHNYEGSTTDGSEIPSRRHKTRLGLAMLLQLPAGQELKTNERLLEHAAILEGMLDRLRHSCVETQGVERSLVSRLYRASGSCTLRLLKLLMTTEAEKQQSPLFWHDLLLNSVLPVNLQLSTVYRGLQQMCSLLEELDTKSTNFFLSTIVTAVLTHHLGWVHTAPPYRNRQLMETFGQQYPCNPLWAQLSDLYGALGTPARIAHTVIAGDSEKANLIDAVLTFLSYFLRSGLVEKRRETRCTKQEDVAEAIAILERVIRNNPSLEQPVFSNYSSSSGKRCAKSLAKKTSKKLEPINSDTSAETAYPLTKSKSYEEPRKGLKKLETDLTNGDSSSIKVKSNLEIESRSETLVYENQSSMKKLKRSSTLQKNLNEYALSNSAVELHAAMQTEDNQAKSKVKIIVSDESERKPSHNDNELLRNLEKSCSNVEMDPKLAMLKRQKLNGFDILDFEFKTLEEQLPYGFSDDLTHEAKSQVYFTLGGEEKSSSTNVSLRERLKSNCKCQCSYTFTRVPSTSADLPEGVLRKIIQRNFPESSKNMQPSEGCESDFGICFKCRRGYASSSQGFVNGKLLLETPTNATEMLRGCGSSGTSSGRIFSSNSMEALIEATCVVELPMPRSKKVPPLLKRKSSERVGFAHSLMGSKTVLLDENVSNSGPETGYTWGMVVQGFTKRKKKGRRRVVEETASTQNSKMGGQDKMKYKDEEKWWWPIQEGLGIEAKFPLVDQPVSEAFCILADLDNWQVGLLSNNSIGSAPIPVGMSRLVSNMLEAFTFMWKEFRSPEQCIKLLESRLREMWLRSETLAEFLLAADLDDASVDNLTSFLDVDAADLPLLLAVATTHSPQIAQRFGLTLA